MSRHEPRHRAGDLLHHLVGHPVRRAALGVKSAHESGVKVEQGHADAAPINPRLGVKFTVTTVIAGVIFLFVWWLITRSGLTLDDVPFMPQLRPS